MTQKLSSLGRAAWCALLGLSAFAAGCGQETAAGTEADVGEPTAGSSFSALPSPPCPNVGLTAPNVYYACDCAAGAAAGCQPGNDANLGTRASPFRSYERARQKFAELGPGETVAFCRGGAFEMGPDRDWINPNCSASQPCVVRDYQPTWSTATLQRPILIAADGDGFSFEDGGNSDHEEGYTFLNLDIRSTSGGQLGRGFFAFNDVDDVLVCGATISGFAFGFTVGGSNPPEPGSDGRNSGIILRNSIVRDNGVQGFMGGCDNCGVDYCILDNNGFYVSDPDPGPEHAALNHNIYLDARGATGMFIRYNEVYRSAMFDGKCEGAPIVVHGVQTDLTIEGNLVAESIGAAGGGCWGIAVDTGWGGEAEGFENVTIRGNTVKNVGNVGIGLNGCQGCTIENNVVIQEQAFESALISVPNRSRNPDDLPMDRVTIRNNSLLARSTSRAKGIVLGGEGSGHVVVSNALLSLGTGGFTCFEYDLAHGNYAARDNNDCWGTNIAWTDPVPSLSNWQIASGDDLASISLNPRFTRTTSPHNLKPLSDSPLINLGHDTLSTAADINGKARTDPDMGAYEY